MDIGKQTRVIRVEPIEIELPVEPEVRNAAGDGHQPNGPGAEPAVAPAGPVRAHRRPPRRREAHETTD